MDRETEALVRLVRPVLKNHIKQTRSLLAFLTELEERLDAQPGGTAHGDTHETEAAA